jgi:dinuclear metal center YbgI/SA1388 family protein
VRAVRRVADLVSAMETLAPPRWAARWDNVGLLVGDTGSPLTHVLLAIDCTGEVVAEARRRGAEAIVSYHPVVFDAQKRFVAPSPAFEAARAGIAVYSPHTALDAAEGGTNDVLADMLGMQERRPLRGLDAVDSGGTEVKLVTFVPAENVEAVSQAVFAAGAGRIGKYSACSFRSPGTGTFFGEEGASPVVGQAGRLEEAPELRLETVVPVSKVPDVMRALRAAHPYEEPAFDLVRLAPAPGAVGFGRVGKVTTGPVHAFVDKVKAGLGAKQVLVVGPLERTVSRAAVCAGSGGELLGDATAAGAELFVTGELRHHEALAAVNDGLTVVCALHSTSERVALVALEKRLSACLAGVTVALSDADREPFTFV